jgi:hypothetical protein
MRLSEEFARTCVKRAQPELEDLREQFEGLAQQEEVLRRHAERMHDIAQARKLKEDVSIPGHLATGIERLTPVPHTATEAAIRLPLIGAAGLGGYHVGKLQEPFDVDELTRILRPAEGKPNIRSAVMMATGQDPVKARELERLLLTTDPAELAGALRRRPFPVSGIPGVAWSRATRERIGALGNIERLRHELESIARQTSKDVLPKVRPWRLGGGALGLLAGSVLTGLPLALRAMWLKQYGGEAAARAESEAQQAIEDALGAQAKRERLLGSLEGAA